MRKRTPALHAFTRPDGVECDLSPRALERWTPSLVAAAPKADATISILDPIGFDPWSEEGGVTAKRIAGALRSIGPEAEVDVIINSPGGDLFEGLAIYNLLRDRKGKVRVKVIGMAASAASIIAMAGTEVLIARAGFLMIHNTWVLAVGNRNDLRAIADTLEPFDAAMASIYSANTGLDESKVQKMMDAETWIGGTAAIEEGFADGLLPADEIATDTSARRAAVAAHTAELAMAKGGLPRSARRAVIQEIRAGTRDAAGPNGTRDAAAKDEAMRAAASEYLQFLTSFTEKTQ